ncbi:unnamed protein product [Prorocentrum cordatum]|uniref:Secreted protein n=1 Tax=Prorocentrum cordatum TaxID=2364126 RepID=A0ABN9Q2T1_9DINO|nr:unnamed protein product [Polarella glacialis]
MLHLHADLQNAFIIVCRYVVVALVAVPVPETAAISSSALNVHCFSIVTRRCRAATAQKKYDLRLSGQPPACSLVSGRPPIRAARSGPPDRGRPPVATKNSFGGAKTHHTTVPEFPERAPTLPAGPTQPRQWGRGSVERCSRLASCSSSSRRSGSALSARAAGSEEQCVVACTGEVPFPAVFC